LITFLTAGVCVDLRTIAPWDRVTVLESVAKTRRGVRSVHEAVRQFGIGAEIAVLAEWLVKDGERVYAGQPLYALESDKAAQEIEAPASGRAKLVAQVGVTGADKKINPALRLAPRCARNA
jgi:multidrug efflux pump subunit AcrA (membrane-fusion protein)